MAGNYVPERQTNAAASELESGKKPGSRKESFEESELTKEEKKSLL